MRSTVPQLNTSIQAPRARKLKVPDESGHEVASVACLRPIPPPASPPRRALVSRYAAANKFII